ncbi:uncharacterized protein KY384_008528 [Bacidia gigantensis]|uniref:uncharacterized protein n=1 Tax=Bacidia gigantensis TaxID=2732470 RepID=UPI001D03BE90|nr:uncharacterized protein KY384_008528 [Bacidia gigantensis]KAG8527099.1 hypothetical protein KY384_008528 [Bacidia gigantensis]
MAPPAPLNSNPQSLEGRVALITGASSGLGRAIALLFAAHGAMFIVCADLTPDGPITSSDTKSDTEDDLPTADLINRRHGNDKAIWTPTDVRKGEDIADAVELAVSSAGRLDMEHIVDRQSSMINNAGIGAEFSKIHELDEKVWDNMMYVVSTPTFILHLSPTLPSPFLSLPSTFQLKFPLSPSLTYHAPLYPHAHMPEVLRTPMSKPNIESQELSKRFMDATPWGTWGEVQDVAKGYLFLASDDAAWITGVGLPIDGGMLAM